MRFNQTKTISAGRSAGDLRPAGLRVVFALATIAGLLIVPGGRGLAQDAKPKEAQQAKLELGDLIKRANQSVVLINIENRSGQKIGFGSGFLIDKQGLIATNLHVVKQAAKVRVVFEFHDGNTATVKCLRAYDKKRDLAIIELEKTPPAARPLSLGPRAFPALGDTVTAIGHPQGLNFTATNGIVGGIRKASDQAQVKLEDDRVFVQSTAFIGGGSSGGPLLSQYGQVIGVNTSVLPGQGISFAVHVSHLIDLLAKARGATPAPLPGNEGSELYNPLADLEPRVQRMYDEYANAINEFNKQIQAAPNQAQLRIIQRTQDPSPKYAKRFWQIAGEERRTTAGFQALYLAAAIDNPAAPDSVFKPAVERILEDHAKERWLHNAFGGLASQDHESLSALYRETLKRNPHHTVQGAASYYLACRLIQKPKYDEAEVVTLLKRCTGEFKDVKLEFEVEDQNYEYALADLAKPILRGIECFCVGKKPPDIVGGDVTGKTFKLSDYKGKVVVLDFFADWCPYCVKMYPEERELTEKLAGKPFAMLGVNCDSQDTLRQILTDKRVTWRCWSDGRSGPIATDWQLKGYPLMFVLDHEGVIRHKFEGMTKPGQLKEAVTKLVSAVPGYRPPIAQAAALSGHATSETVEFAAISRDGRRILSGSADRMTILWDRESGRVVRKFGPAGGKIISALFSPDGRRAATAGEDKVIRLWDLETGRLVRELKGHVEWVFSLAFSPDGRLLYSTSGGPDIRHEGKDSAVRVWDVESGREVRRLEGHKGRVLSVTVSPDGRQVLAGGDRTVILWDANRGKIIRRFEGHTDLLTCVSFLPDSQRFVSGSFDQTIRLWDLKSGKEIHRLVGHPNAVTWFAVSPDGHQLLSSDYNAHELRLWNLDSLEHVERIDLGRISPTRGSFGPDGRQAVWPGSEGTLRVYELATAAAVESLANSAKRSDPKISGAKPVR